MKEREGVPALQEGARRRHELILVRREGDSGRDGVLLVRGRGLALFLTKSTSLPGLEYEGAGRNLQCGSKYMICARREMA